MVSDRTALGREPLLDGIRTILPWRQGRLVPEILARRTLYGTKDVGELGQRLYQTLVLRCEVGLRRFWGCQDGGAQVPSS